MQIFTSKPKPKAKTTSEHYEIKKHIKTFNIEDLVCDHDAQRELDIDWVNHLIKEWDEKVCMPPVVVIEDGINKVVDGQHSLTAMKHKGYITVECILLQDISAYDAFLKINNTKEIETLDKFRKRALSNEYKYEKEIFSIFNKYEVEISTYGEGAYFKDVQIFYPNQKDFITIDKTLNILTNVLEYDCQISKNMFNQVYDIFIEYPNSFDKIKQAIRKDRDRLMYECDSVSKKAIKQLHLKYKKSKLKEELLKII